MAPPRPVPRRADPERGDPGRGGPERGDPGRGGPESGDPGRDDPGRDDPTSRPKAARRGIGPGPALDLAGLLDDAAAELAHDQVAP